MAPGAQWIIILFVYAGIASLLPVWLLLQPRDYINGIQLFIGLGLLYGAVLIANPTIVAPAINANVPASAPPIFPLLFVTIACGAISGFHGLVGSGTTSKQPAYRLAVTGLCKWPASAPMRRWRKLANR